MDTKAGSDGAAIAAGVSIHRAPFWLQSADSSALKDFVETGHKIWCATVGPHDLIFVPCGYVGTHKVIGNTNLVGLRVGAVTKSDVGNLRDAKTSQEKAGKVATIIKQALEYLGDAGAVAA